MPTRTLWSILRPRFGRSRPQVRKPRGTNWQPGGGDIMTDIDSDRYTKANEDRQGYGGKSGA